MHPLLDLIGIVKSHYLISLQHLMLQWSFTYKVGLIIEMLKIPLDSLIMIIHQILSMKHKQDNTYNKHSDNTIPYIDQW